MTKKNCMGVEPEAEELDVCAEKLGPTLEISPLAVKTPLSSNNRQKCSIVL